ncbi:MAG: hypothetical protein B7Z30_02885 [Rhizobiales bacterium 12-68-15]|nr:MAG: hypothetical protein B7Z30_02885 [Rhizobiales bacterium 12-68-15]
MVQLGIFAGAAVENSSMPRGAMATRAVMVARWSLRPRNSGATDAPESRPVGQSFATPSASSQVSVGAWRCWRMP